MNIRESLRHAWNRLKHLNILRATSKPSSDCRVQPENSNIVLTKDNSRDYQNTKPGEHIYTRRPNSRGSRIM